MRGSDHALVVDRHVINNHMQQQCLRQPPANICIPGATREDIRPTTSRRREQLSFTHHPHKRLLRSVILCSPVILLSPIKIYASLISVTACPECWLSSSTAFHFFLRFFLAVSPCSSALFLPCDPAPLAPSGLTLATCQTRQTQTHPSLLSPVPLSLLPS